MLWPIVLPFKITFWCLAVLVGIATAAAPLFKWKRRSTFLIASLIAWVAFIPVCAGIMVVIDRQRFGVFEYGAFDDVNDLRVERYLPTAATAITIDKLPQGFRARYTITEPELIRYLDDLWTRYGELSIDKRGEAHSISERDREYCESLFGDLEWPPLDDAIVHESPRARNGAGFSVWYSPKECLAYQRACYW